MYDGDFPFSYLASSYSHRDPTWTEEQRFEHREVRYRAAVKATGWCLSKKLWVYSPIVHCHDLARAYKLPTDALFWQQYNEAMIDSFKAVVVLCDDSWQSSRGVNMEINFATERGYVINWLIPREKHIDEGGETYLITGTRPAN